MLHRDKIKPLFPCPPQTHLVFENDVWDWADCVIGCSGDDGRRRPSPGAAEWPGRARGCVYAAHRPAWRQGNGCDPTSSSDVHERQSSSSGSLSTHWKYRAALALIRSSTSRGGPFGVFARGGGLVASAGGGTSGSSLTLGLTARSRFLSDWFSFSFWDDEWGGLVVGLSV